MITINHSPGRISIEGHAGYAPLGQDIVCAAVSTVAQTFLASVEELTTDKLKTDIAAGNVVIEYGTLTAEGQTLLASFFVGIRMIADGYPEYVKLTEP